MYSQNMLERFEIVGQYVYHSIKPFAYELTRRQDKRITIVQGGELLLNDAYPVSFRKLVARSVRKRDVTVILNDRVDDMEISDAGIVNTRSGRKLVADLVVRHI